MLDRGPSIGDDVRPDAVGHNAAGEAALGQLLPSRRRPAAGSKLVDEPNLDPRKVGCVANRLEAEGVVSCGGHALAQSGPDLDNQLSVVHVCDLGLGKLLVGLHQPLRCHMCAHQRD